MKEQEEYCPTVKIDIKKKRGEFCVRWIEDGRRNEDRCYYTEDPNDAEGTAQVQREWAERNGYRVI